MIDMEKNFVTINVEHPVCTYFLFEKNLSMCFQVTSIGVIFIQQQNVYMSARIIIYRNIT